MNSKLNHIAFLVNDIDKILNKNLKQFSHSEIESFPSEGTRELYLGTQESMARVLLMEPTSEGPYLTAMKKRGPGLHHIAIDVLNIQEFVDSLKSSGWYIHPSSINSFMSSKCLFLARPGTPFLVEVLQQSTVENKPTLVDEIVLCVQKPSLISALACDQIVVGENNTLKINNVEYNLCFFYE